MMRVSGILAAIWLVGALAAPAPAQVTQQNKLAGPFVGGYPFELGTSLALSADGNTTFLGGQLFSYGENPPPGASSAFARASGVWTQQGSPLMGPGPAVALSGDGNTALTGEPHYGYDVAVGVIGSGATQVSTRVGGVWTEQATLVGTGIINQLGEGDQGISVALSHNGNTALVGGPVDNNGAGAAWVFIRTAGTWTQQAKLVGSDAIGAAWQGASVALSRDGNTALVGGPQDNNGVGAAWVFTRTAGGWAQQGPKLVGANAVGIADQGWAVALSFNGNRALIGGPGDNTGAGAAWLFRRVQGVWTQHAKLLGSDAIGAAGQGSAVALSGDGKTALVGGPYDNQLAGAAWLYAVVGRSWTQQGPKLVGTGAIGNAEQGAAVALSRDGSTILVGGPEDDSTITSLGISWPLGAAWVFTQPALAGMPGTGECVAQSVEPLIRQYGGLNNAAQAMGFANVSLLESAILGHCRESS